MAREVLWTPIVECFTPACAALRKETPVTTPAAAAAAGLHEPRETVYLRAAALPELPPLLALLITPLLARCALSTVYLTPLSVLSKAGT